MSSSRRSVKTHPLGSPQESPSGEAEPSGLCIYCVVFLIQCSKTLSLARNTHRPAGSETNGMIVTIILSRAAHIDNCQPCATLPSGPSPFPPPPFPPKAALVGVVGCMPPKQAGVDRHCYSLMAMVRIIESLLCTDVRMDLWVHGLEALVASATPCDLTHQDDGDISIKISGVSMRKNAVQSTQ